MINALAAALAHKRGIPSAPLRWTFFPHHQKKLRGRPRKARLEKETQRSDTPVATITTFVGKEQKEEDGGRDGKNEENAERKKPLSLPSRRPPELRRLSKEQGPLMPSSSSPPLPPSSAKVRVRGEGGGRRSKQRKERHSGRERQVQLHSGRRGGKQGGGSLPTKDKTWEGRMKGPSSSS